MIRNAGHIFYMLLVCQFFAHAASALAQDWQHVKWVNDGDTIVLVDGRSVRYIGVNATEIDHENRTAEPFGYAARKFNAAMVKSSKIRLEFDLERYDHYGRLLAYIFLEDGTFVNARLLEAGMAYYLFKKPNLKYSRLLLQSQRKAMGARTGIWVGWREKKKKYPANKKSKRFHLEACAFGRTIDPKNRLYFSTKWDAFWAGYAPAHNCQPVFAIPSD